MDVLDPFIARVDELYLQSLRTRLGLALAEDQDTALIRQLLNLLQTSAADYTLTLRGLADVLTDPQAIDRLMTLMPADPQGLAQWVAHWQARLSREPSDLSARKAAMLATSPTVIPRNHLVESALSRATIEGDLRPFLALLAAVQRPYEPPTDPLFTTPPRPQERVRLTFCGT
jgi:uncharacterized protein YdiU (UPF0061 family)